MVSNVNCSHYENNTFLLLRYSVSEELKQTNLLFIMHDDLRPQLPTYGADYMITPNYDKLASKSVVFDYAYCQVAVCNPSRDSMMTGLRPDTVGTYNFQHTYDPHLVFPMKLVAAGYNTAMFGKVLHWPNEDRRIWNFEHWENGWYEYQSKETAYMNASVMPDKVLPEENFRDALYADKAVKSLNKMVDQNKPFMLSIGFKLPHIELHVPYKHYELYKNKSDTWQLTRNELRFPPTAHEASYRCCADINYRFMHEEGAKPAIKSVRLGNINSVLPGEMHDELMATYCASISYLDVQLGKLLDVMDARNLWQNTTVILTSDHGMHLGEKGLWEKWSLFEESTRVPLMIYHPQSPFKGQHYPYPVELIDVFPTINDILKAKFDDTQICKSAKCLPLSGKSLAKVVLGETLLNQTLNHKASKTGAVTNDNNALPVLDQKFAISQTLRCAPKNQLEMVAVEQQDSSSGTSLHKKTVRKSIWVDCDKFKKDNSMLSVLGYSMRTPDYRYTAYFHYNLITNVVDVVKPPYAQELYNHKNETLKDFRHRETVNLYGKPIYDTLAKNLLHSLVQLIKTIPFHDQKK